MTQPSDGEQSAQALLQRVCGSLDLLVQQAGPHEGLLPSMLDPVSGDMLAAAPPAITGQRDGDRSWRGSNLIHDESVLLTLYGLAEAQGRSDYADAADRYLQRFATHCADTASGLFPWGEHSYWDLDRDCVGDSHWHRDATREGQAIHDHLRATPVWMWERLGQHNPRCLERFAEGLDNHWTVGEGSDTLEYIRHGFIEQRTRHPRGARSCDFPRHGGFFIIDWACAWRATGRAEFLAQIDTMVDYWWPRRDERNLLLIESRSPTTDAHFHDTNAPGQTLSLAVSLHEAATLLADGAPELAQTMRDRAAAYIEGFLQAPHDVDAGVFAILSKRADNSLHQQMPVWGSVYGVWPASYVALTCLLGYRQTGDGRLLDWARAVGARYVAEPIPAGVQVPAMDAGLGLGLLADLYDITGEQSWLDAAMVLTQDLVRIFYPDINGAGAVLPCGAAGIDWYESQMGPDFLLHGLARTALLSLDGPACPLAADYTAR